MIRLVKAESFLGGPGLHFKIKSLHDLRKKHDNELHMDKKYHAMKKINESKSCENVLCSILDLHKDDHFATTKASSWLNIICHIVILTKMQKIKSILVLFC